MVEYIQDCWHSLWLKIKGSIKSWTMHWNVWSAIVIASLPTLESQFPGMQQFLPDNVYKAAFGLIVAGNIILRLKTNKDLAHK